MESESARLDSGASRERILKFDSTAKTLHLDREAELYAAVALASLR
jgi:hypothetical protein